MMIPPCIYAFGAREAVSGLDANTEACVKALDALVTVSLIIWPAANTFPKADSLPNKSARPDRACDLL